MKYDIITIGDTTYDIFIKPHEAQTINSAKKGSQHAPYEKMLCFSYGDKIEVEDVTYSLGGTACNVAVGLKKLGLDTGLMSFCGGDDFGLKVKKIIDDIGIELVNFITDRTIHTTYSFILRYKSDRTILVYRDHFDYKKLTIAKAKNTKWLYLSSLGDGYEKDAIKLMAEKNIKLAMNPGKHQLEEKKKEFLLLLKMAEIVIVNKEEAQILAGARFPLSIKEIYYKLSEYNIKNLIITDAVHGAYARVGREIIYQKAMRADAIEQTGAGDAFGAGFLARYFETEDTIESLKWGVVNGAKVTEKIGAQAGLLDRRQMEKIVARIK